MLAGISNGALNDMQASSHLVVVEASDMPLTGVPTLGYLLRFRHAFFLRRMTSLTA